MLPSIYDIVLGASWALIVLIGALTLHNIYTVMTISISSLGIGMLSILLDQKE